MPPIVIPSASSGAVLSPASTTVPPKESTPPIVLQSAGVGPSTTALPPKVIPSAPAGSVVSPASATVPSKSISMVSAGSVMAPAPALVYASAPSTTVVNSAASPSTEQASELPVFNLLSNPVVGPLQQVHGPTKV
ncbi:hypothetical protein PIB30_074918 [Stylosanthes scabra]|uniref:Uncharacterized protein n=1 Tax=Stylosanthes scabra TaxID=79078 RepID=A0ABU6XR01_9FABA|nr:hypothetical protein [Stylosanthes scabra]